ncbi:MAG: S8 family serine peptidase [Bdellovibrionales bacterium]|nr:S8 family serine peptidase [Bdellovibrionales bacterium]
MSCRFILGFFLLHFLAASIARAERWILVNPSIQRIQNQKVFVRHQLRIGSTQFVVIESDHISSLAFDSSSLARQFGAESVQPDFPIGWASWLRSSSKIPSSEIESDISEKAWHLKKLSFTTLPSEKSGRGVTVAVIDTGVDYTHRQLSTQMWVNKAEIPSNRIDDDHNGFVDDVYGYDFVSGDPDPMDSHSHGTHVAGLVAALPFGVGAGIAPEAKIMAVRVLDNSLSSTFLSDAAQGIIYAVDNGAQILSSSWRVYKSWNGYEPSEENLLILRKAIEYAEARGVIFVTAAGNEALNLEDQENKIYPAGFLGLENMVVVTSSDKNDHLSLFSNYGTKSVDVVAPGSNVLSTVPGDRWRQMSGTSMAAPLVAGILARGLSGGCDPFRLIDRLFETAKLRDSFSNKVMSGFINPVDLLND